MPRCHCIWIGHAFLWSSSMSISRDHQAKCLAISWLYQNVISGCCFWTFPSSTTWNVTASPRSRGITGRMSCILWEDMCDCTLFLLKTTSLDTRLSTLLTVHSTEMESDYLRQQGWTLQPRNVKVFVEVIGMGQGELSCIIQRDVSM